MELHRPSVGLRFRKTYFARADKVGTHFQHRGDIIVFGVVRLIFHEIEISHAVRAIAALQSHNGHVGAHGRTVGFDDLQAVGVACLRPHLVEAFHVGRRALVRCRHVQPAFEGHVDTYIYIVSQSQRADSARGGGSGFGGGAQKVVVYFQLIGRRIGCQVDLARVDATGGKREDHAKPARAHTGCRSRRSIAQAEADGSARGSSAAQERRHRAADFLCTLRRAIAATLIGCIVYRETAAIHGVEAAACHLGFNGERERLAELVLRDFHDGILQHGAVASYDDAERRGGFATLIRELLAEIGCGDAHGNGSTGLESALARGVEHIDEAVAVVPFEHGRNVGERAVEVVLVHQFARGKRDALHLVHVEIHRRAVGLMDGHDFLRPSAERQAE